MARVEQSIADLPLRADLLHEAFVRFRETGELPEVQRLAVAVIEKARLGERPARMQGEVSLREGIEELQRLVGLIESGELPRPKPDQIRQRLYHEAVCDELCVRIPAREALQVLAARGRDVTQPLYLDEEIGLPEYGTVGLHVLGWPECFVVPPYEQQAQRLFARYERLREQIDQGNEAWLRSLGEAAWKFQATGWLPKDELMRNCVLVDGELHALMEAHAGRDDPELMAAFDQAARTRKHRRAIAIDNLVHIVWERRTAQLAALRETGRS